MMIAQHQTDAASRPSITIFTSQSACRNSASSEKSTGAAAGALVVTSGITLVAALTLGKASWASAGAQKLTARATKAATTISRAFRCVARSEGVFANVMKGPFVSAPAGPAPDISGRKGHMSTPGPDAVRICQI